MKKLFFAVMVLLAAGCTQQGKVERLVEDYIRENANDPSSVEIISISEVVVDSVTDYEQTDECARMLENFNTYNDACNSEMDLGHMKNVDGAIKEMDNILKKIDEKKASFKPYLEGYHVDVVYRAKNGFGALMKTTSHVRLSKDMTQIVGFE